MQRKDTTKIFITILTVSFWEVIGVWLFWPFDVFDFLFFCFMTIVVCCNSASTGHPWLVGHRWRNRPFLQSARQCLCGHWEWNYLGDTTFFLVLTVQKHPRAHHVSVPVRSSCPAAPSETEKFHKIIAFGRFHIFLFAKIRKHRILHTHHHFSLFGYYLLLKLLPPFLVCAVWCAN